MRRDGPGKGQRPPWAVARGACLLHATRIVRPEDTDQTHPTPSLDTASETITRLSPGDSKDPSLTPVPMWMNLEGIVLREVSQSQKDISCRVPLMGGT